VFLSRGNDCCILKNKQTMKLSQNLITCSDVCNCTHITRFESLNINGYTANSSVSLVLQHENLDVEQCTRYSCIFLLHSRYKTAVALCTDKIYLAVHNTASLRENV